MKQAVLNEQQAIVGNIINSLNQTTVVEKESNDKQQKVEAEEKLRKSEERHKALSLFD